MPAGVFICSSLDISKVPTAMMNSSNAAHVQGEMNTQARSTMPISRPETERINNSFMIIYMAMQK